MLNRTKTRIAQGGSVAGAKLLSTLTLANLAEGQAMIGVRENNDGVYRPSNGTANTIFGGFSMFNERIVPTTAAKVETLTAVGTTLTLSKTPLNPTTDLLLKTSGGVVLAYNVALGAGQYTISGNVVTLNAAQSGLIITATYKHDLTVNEAIMLYGTGILGASSVEQLKTVDLITKGDIFTDQYDPAIDWAAIDTDASGEVLKARANGLISINGNGAVIYNAFVISVPTPDDPYLGIRII